MVLAVFAVLVTSCSGKTSPPTEHPSPTGKGSAASLDELTGGGIVVVDSEADVGELKPGSIVLLRGAAERMLDEARAGGGVLGADIDAIAPLPEGAPPMSYFVAAWVTLGQSQGARTAASWMGEQDWKHAGRVVFPAAVVALFTADMLKQIDAELPAVPASATLPRADAGAVMPAAFVPVAAGPCSEVTEFLGKALSTVFDALRINPASIPGLPPVLKETAGFLVGLWNKAVELAEGVVKGVTKTVLAPIVQALQIGLGALSVATVVVSYLKTWTMTVNVDPKAVDDDTYRFAVDAEPDINGTFVARAPQLADQWPAAIRDCAQVVGAKLPELLAPGAQASWTILENQGVIFTGPLSAPVAGDRTISLPFTTGRETSEAAKGEAQFGSAIVRVHAPRKELQDFFDLARDQISTVRDQLLDKVPNPQLRAAAQARIDALINPVVSQLQADVQDTLGGIVTLAGTGVVIVKYHRPPEQTPPPSPPPSASASASPKKDTFCDVLRDTVRWEQQHGEEFADVETFAKEIRKWWVKALAVAPAKYRADVQVMITYDDAVVARDYLSLMPLMEQVGQAGLRLQAYCGLDGWPKSAGP